MATTTTNYGFDVPTSSDLVKNGATAISTLGQDIDTFLFRPLGVNPVINSNFSVWQRGTSIAAAGSVVYAADRFAFYRADLSTGATVSRQVTGDTTNLPNIQYCARVQRDSGNTGTVNPVIAQPFETASSIPYAGKSVIVSFYARAGANFSAAGSILAARIGSGTGTDQSANSFRAGSWTGQTTLATLSQAITTTWTRYSFTATIGATATQLNLTFQYTPVGTAGANDYFEITGIQMEASTQSVASPFQTASGGNPQAELAMCQRYYFRNTAAAVYTTFTPYSPAVTTTVWDGFVQLPVSMRVFPTVLETSNVSLTDNVSGVYTTGTWALNGSYYSTTTPCIRYTHGSAVLTAYRSFAIQANNNSAAFIGFSAEL